MSNATVHLTHVAAAGVGNCRSHASFNTFSSLLALDLCEMKLVSI